VDTPGYAEDVAVAQCHAYLADGWSGLQIAPVQCPCVPQAVQLSAFEAAPVPEGILVTWSTSLESDHLGFHVHRSTSMGGDYARVTAELIAPPGPYRFLDREVSPGTTYFFRLEAIDRQGGREFFGPLAARMEAAPQQGDSRLAGAHPNPFRGGRGPVAIAFELGGRTRARLRIFDAAGRLVGELADGSLAAGEHVVLWDGRNAAGAEVGSGIYFYRLDAGSFSATRPLVKLP